MRLIAMAAMFIATFFVTSQAFAIGTQVISDGAWNCSNNAPCFAFLVAPPGDAANPINFDNCQKDWCYQYLMHTGGNSYVDAKWQKGPYASNGVNNTWYAWIPSNGLPYDGVVRYTVSAGTSTCYRNVNQEAYANAYAVVCTRTGVSATDNMKMSNVCQAGCQFNEQVWWDAVQVNWSLNKA